MYSTTIQALALVGLLTAAHQSPNSHPQHSAQSKTMIPTITAEDKPYQTLFPILKRYGCPVVSFFHRSEPVSRMEFAIALNTCSKRLLSLTPAPSSQDLATLKELEQEFSVELKILHDQIDSLEARTATLEPQQFSTIGKMTPTVIFTFPLEADVNPADWEFKSLRSLAERYKCSIRNAYGKNQKVTRTAFTRDLNLCLAQIQQNYIESIAKEDAVLIEKLQQAFSIERSYSLEQHPINLPHIQDR